MPGCCPSVVTALSACARAAHGTSSIFWQGPCVGLPASWRPPTCDKFTYLEAVDGRTRLSITRGATGRHRCRPGIGLLEALAGSRVAAAAVCAKERSEAAEHTEPAPVDVEVRELAVGQPLVGRSDPMPRSRGGAAAELAKQQRQLDQLECGAAAACRRGVVDVNFVYFVDLLC